MAEQPSPTSTNNGDESPTEGQPNPSIILCLPSTSIVSQDLQTTTPFNTDDPASFTADPVLSPEPVTNDDPPSFTADPVLSPEPVTNDDPPSFTADPVLSPEPVTNDDPPSFTAPFLSPEPIEETRLTTHACIAGWNDGVQTNVSGRLTLYRTGLPESVWIDGMVVARLVVTPDRGRQWIVHITRGRDLHERGLQLTSRWPVVSSDFCFDTSEDRKKKKFVCICRDEDSGVQLWNELDLVAKAIEWSYALEQEYGSSEQDREYFTGVSESTP